MGRYRLLDRIGRGSFADVFRAKSFGVEGFEKTLVVKALLPEYAEQPPYAGAFVQAAQRALRLSHTNVVQVFDLGETGDGVGQDRPERGYFMAMEYVAGLDLHVLFERWRLRSELPPLGMCLYVAAEAAKGLEHAHRRRDEELKPLGIVHGAVSPSNVLVSWDGDVKLVDFEVARALLSAHEPADSFAVKYAYLSPEQAAGDAPTAASDVFSLALVFYTLASGAHPFLAASAEQTLRNVRSGAVPPLREVRPDLPARLSSLVEKALSVQPDRRLSVSELYEEILSETYAVGARFGAAELSGLLDGLRRPPSVASRGVDELLARPVTLRPRSEPPAEESAASRQAGLLRPRPQPGAALATRAHVTALILSFARKSPAPRPLRDRARHILLRYGARVLEERPTEVVALFGVDDPDGRDTEVAVRSGLVLLRSLSVGNFDPGIAVDASRVRVENGHGLAEAPSVSALVERARAVLSAGDRGLLITADAARNVADRFALERLESGAKSPRRVTGLETSGAGPGSFVGRRVELEHVAGVLVKAAQGKLAVVLLSGEQGMGKTRLLQEIQRRLGRRGSRVAAYAASCPRRGLAIPYSGVAGMLRRLCGVREGDSAERVAAVEPRLRALGLGDDEVRAVLAEIGVGGSSQPPGAGVLELAVTRMVHQLSEERFHLLVWDDAQWLDSASVDLLTALTQRLASARVALLFSARPAQAAPYTRLPVQSEVWLGELDPDAAGRLIALRAGLETAPAALVEMVRERAGGHPMFIAELVREAVESGTLVVRNGEVADVDVGQSLAVPRNLRALLAARLCRLSEADRDLLAAAAIFETAVEIAVLARMLALRTAAAEATVSRLEGCELLHRDGPVAVAFSSPLVREVVLAELDEGALKELHLRAAFACHATTDEGPGEDRARVAHHLERAGENDEAARFYAEAGLSALPARRFELVVRFLGRALELAELDSRPTEEIAVWVHALATGIPYVSSRHHLSPLAERLLAHLDSAPALDPRARVQIRTDLAVMLAALHRPDAAEELLAQAITEADAFPDLGRAAFVTRADIANARGDFNAALVALRRAKKLGAGVPSEQHRMLLAFARAHAGAGNVEQALKALDGAETLAVRDDSVLACERAKVRALVLGYNSDHEGAAEAYLEAAAMAREAGLSHEAAWSLHNQGMALMRLGQLPRSYAALQSSLSEARQIGAEPLMNRNELVLGYLEAMRGAEGGLSVLMDGIRRATAERRIDDVITGKILLGRLLRARGDRPGAERELEEAKRLAVRAGNIQAVQECTGAFGD